MLIECVVHYEGMFGLLLTAAIIVFLPLVVYVAGADSRIDDVARRRRYNG